MNTTAIANHLNVVESAIVRVEEWAHVLLVVCKKLGARFVSKKVIQSEQNIFTWTSPNGRRVIDFVILNKSMVEVNGKQMFLTPSLLTNLDITATQAGSLYFDLCKAAGKSTAPSKTSLNASPVLRSEKSLEYHMYNENGRFFG